MITNHKKTCLVLDLDDTLYKEYDYQTSGLKFIEDKVRELYDIDLKGKLLNLRDQGNKDIFQELTNILQIPTSVKKSFLSMYRFHKPNIELTLDVKKFIKFALKEFRQVAILTDGRSISQRLKLESLNLLKIPTYISEEWNSTKPDDKRFIAIMHKYDNCSKFCYIADNPSKDFVTPNALNWQTIGLQKSTENIHPQTLGLNKNYYPDLWIECLTEII
jgi:putative hydrolase of the HAD superfamily